MYKWLAVGHKTRTLPQPRPPPPALALLGPVAHAKYGWHAAVGPARHGPARSGSDRSGIVWCPLCGTYACNYFYKFIHIVPFMALPVAGLRGRQRAARSSSIDLLLTLPSSYFLQPPLATLALPPQPLCGAHLSVTACAWAWVGNDAASPKLHADRIIAAPNQTKPNCTASPAPPHEAGPRPTSFKYPLKSEIYALALCKRRLRITARPDPEPETESQNHRPAQVSTREATPNIYFEVGKIIAGSWRR